MTFSFLCFIILISTIIVLVLSESSETEDKNLDTRDTPLERYICFEEKTFPYAMVFMIMFLTIFFLGFMKGIIGLICSRKIGMFGLNVLLDLPHPINRYYEPQLRCEKVVYDAEGWPIHPVTHKRVRIINESSELCINTVFFFAFPFFVMWVALQNACHCYENSDESGSDFHTNTFNPSPHYKETTEKTHLTNSEIPTYCKDKCHGSNGNKRKAKLDTYKDEDDTAEEKDTRYVLEQLTRSEDCLNQVHVVSQETSRK